MTNYREILRLFSQGISQRSIAESCQCSRNTVARVIARCKEVDLAWPLAANVTNGELESQLFPKKQFVSEHRMPDVEYLHRELNKNSVTLRLLWMEYCEDCRRSGETPFMYSQFCYHYQQYAQTRRASMHVPRKPGEQIEIDWAGKNASIVDRDTGEVIPAYVFVAAFSYSQYAYVEAFTKRDQESWITAHVNMYSFFGGVAKILVPDNVRTAVDNTSWYTPAINRVYREMAEHYNTAVIPARPRKPKDKATVEGVVGIISTWIIAALRNRKFFSLAELNQAIRQKLKEFNANPYQKKQGSRESLFLEEEKPLLHLLPGTTYELAAWKTATVQYNYHVSVEKMFYSIPYEYVKKKVDVRMTKNIVEVFYQTHRICSHQRLTGRPGQYSTVREHMPKDHQSYLQWNAQRFLQWAEKVGPNTNIVIHAILQSFKIEQQGYRSCMGLLKLTDKHGRQRVEAACAKALTYTSRPSLKSVRTILVSGQDLDEGNDAEAKEQENTNQYGFIRGANYYGRTMNHDE